MGSPATSEGIDVICAFSQNNIEAKIIAAAIPWIRWRFDDLIHYRTASAQRRSRSASRFRLAQVPDDLDPLPSLEVRSRYLPCCTPRQSAALATSARERPWPG